MKAFFINLAIFDKVLVNEAMNAKFTIFAANLDKYEFLASNNVYHTGISGANQRMDCDE